MSALDYLVLECHAAASVLEVPFEDAEERHRARLALLVAVGNVGSYLEANSGLYDIEVGDAALDATDRYVELLKVY